MVLLSVKPQMMQAALGGIGKVMSADSLVISIAAGISSKFIESALGGSSVARRAIDAEHADAGRAGNGRHGGGQHATADDIAAARHYSNPQPM
jgi:pyrroline-5-carboxylate reductase